MRPALMKYYNIVLYIQVVTKQNNIKALWLASEPAWIFILSELSIRKFAFQPLLLRKFY